MRRRTAERQRHVNDPLPCSQLRYAPIWHVQVRAFGCDMFMRYDETGMPLQLATRRGDWTIGLPDEARRARPALRAIVAAKCEKRTDEAACSRALAWIAEQRRGPLADEARALRAKYLERNPLGQFLRVV